MKKIVCLALAAIMLFGALFTLSACGGNSGKLICGITDFDPMNFKDANGDWIGFDTEFAKLVADKLKMDVKFQEITWTQKYTELESGAINCIWNGFTANSTDKDNNGVDKPRSSYVDFSYGYMLNQQCVVVKADRVGEFTSIDDLLGKTVAVERSSAGDAMAAEAVGDDGEIIGCAAQRDTFIEIKSGAVDCAVVDILLAKNMTGTGNFSDLVIADIELESEIYAIGFKIGSDLKDKVNKAIKELYDDGTLLKLAEKYNLENTLLLDTTTKF